MANQTVTTNLNYDDYSIARLENGETTTINSGSITVSNFCRKG
jgi:hypothetical protein